eukprot:NODE_6199_length_913_cov_45.697468_g5607_i0.p1 GENE.NODE_6199_length_913_cov_45.697468_g5607_i0~~NODE_6199_length_913_cov_45.697468_g5607_i0.p1  ORF type:complete len:272 (-),score=35.20 NODE_6199_length_913_cov_45.697468_g5607_i0:18-833(-)
MSQRQTGNKRKADQNDSQLSQRSYSQRTQTNVSAAAPEPILDQVQHDQLLTSFIRYTLMMHSNKYLIRRSDYMTHVFHDGKKYPHGAFDVIFNDAKKYFNDVFGYRLEVVRKENTLTQIKQPPSYLLLLNSTDHDQNSLKSFTKDSRQHADHGLLFMILSILSMIPTELEEDKLWTYLGELGVKLDASRDCGGFSENPKDMIEKFVRQGYIEKTRHAERVEETSKPLYTYRIGHRTKLEMNEDLKKLVQNIFTEENGTQDSDNECEVIPRP